MWPFKRRFAWEVKSRCKFICENIGCGTVFEDDKIKISCGYTSTSIWIKLPLMGEQVHVFDSWTHNTPVFIYGRWMNYRTLWERFLGSTSQLALP